MAGYERVSIEAMGRSRRNESLTGGKGCVIAPRLTRKRHGSPYRIFRQRERKQEIIFPRLLSGETDVAKWEDTGFESWFGILLPATTHQVLRLRNASTLDLR